ncbi:MAG: cyclic pyranopterin monophosphate synthase MoaC [Pseudomonadota bacterium]
MSGLSHFDSAGQAHMVDVSGKDVTARTAVAEAYLHVAPATMRHVLDGTAQKGDVLGTARLAGIMAAKRTADLIPLCHPLPITNVSIALTPDAEAGTIRIEATVKTTGQTGVEMEALTAASVTALTAYDMLKAVDKEMRVDGLRVILKEGGKSGRYEAT